MSKTEAIKYDSAGDVLLALRDHFNPREYIVLPQVRNGAGFDATRTADAIVMSTWPSRGLMLYGVEIKVSRGDWLREQKKPEKSDEIACYCDHWVVAVSDESIIKEGELPAAWGLLVPGRKPGTLRMKQPPAKLESKTMSRSFLARILKKALEVAVPLSTVDAEIERRVADRVVELESRITARISKELDPERLIEKHNKLLASAEAFKSVTGLWLDAYDAKELKRLAEALKLMRWNALGSWLDQADATMAKISKDIRTLKKSLPPEQEETDEAQGLSPQRAANPVRHETEER